MGFTALTLIITAPMQLAAAAGLELAGGYDSTVLNPGTLVYGDGGILRAAVDVQVGHQSSTVRQLLRNRSEFLYTGGEGRSFPTEGDFLNLTRYGLQWEPDEDWRFNLEATYAIGRASALLNQVGSTDLAFLPGIYSDYGGRGELNHSFSETWRATLDIGSTGRYAVSIPAYQARENTLSFFSQLAVAHDLGENDVGTLSFRAERFLVDGFPDWVLRLTGFTGWAHTFGEDTITQINLGVDAIQDQNDNTHWLTGPYVNVGITQRFPDANLALGATYRHEYALVSSGRCFVPVATNGVCPAGQTTGGGTGQIDALALSAIWHPSEFLTFTADLQGEFGSTLDLDPTNPTVERSVPYRVATASMGGRYRIGQPMYVFVRYDFLYLYTDPNSVLITGASRAIMDLYTKDVIRHVVMAGVEFVLSGGDGPLENIIPLEEINAIQGARTAGGLSAHNSTATASSHNGTSSGSGGSTGGSGGDTGDEMPGDPFDMSAPDPTDQPQTPTSGHAPATSAPADTSAGGGSQGDSSR